MPSDLKFPEIPKISISADFYPYLSAPKSPSKIDTAFNNFLKFTGSEPFKIARYTTKFTSFVFGLKKNLASEENLEAAKESSQVASTVNGALSLFSNIGSVLSLIKTLKSKKEDQTVRNFQISKYCLNIINSFTSFLGILDRFKVIELAKTFPSSVVFSFLSIASNHISIAISILKMKKTYAKLDRIEGKRKITWMRPIENDFAKRKIERVVSRQKNGMDNALKLKDHIEKMEPFLKTQMKIYEEKKETLQKVKEEFATSHKIARFFHTLEEKNDLNTAKNNYKKGIKEYKTALNEINSLEKTYQIRSEKIEKWGSILDSFDSISKESLEQIRLEKLKKWNAKRRIEQLAMVKKGVKIAFSVLSIALTIVSIALTIIFSGSIPIAALIALSGIGISVGTASFLNTLFFKRIKK